MRRRTTTTTAALTAAAALGLAGCGGGDPATFDEAGGDVEAGYAVQSSIGQSELKAGLHTAEPGQSFDYVTSGSYSVTSESYAYRVECRTDDGVTWIRATVPLPGQGWGEMRVEARSDQPGWAAAELLGHRVPLSVQLPGGGLAAEPSVAWSGGSVRVAARSEPQPQWRTTQSTTPLAAYADMRLVCQSGQGD